MLKVTIFLTIFVALSTQIHVQKLTAQLKILTFQPPQFNLTFSSRLALPKFQFLFNQLTIQCTSQPSATASCPLSSQPSCSYIITPKSTIPISQSLSQRFVLIFTQPLLVTNLSLNSFTLRTEKSSMLSPSQLQQLIESSSKPKFYKYQANTPIISNLAIVITSIVYFLAYTTVIGIHSYNFLAVYVYICLQTSFYTGLDYRIAYLLCFQPAQYSPDTNQQFVYICIPHILIAITFLIGVATRIICAKFVNRSHFANFVYYYLVYRLFAITWDIMCIPIFANFVHVLKHSEHFQGVNLYLLYGYIYFSAVVIAMYSYMAYFTVNPQIGQSPEKWAAYIETPHFRKFQGFHLRIDAKNWKKRNFIFIVSLLRLLIVTFVALNIINIPNLLLQLFYLIYLFTLQPFKYNFFNYCLICIQIAVIVLYMYRYLVQLYVSISQHIVTSTDISSVLLSNVIFLCGIIFTYFVLGIYEFYFRMRAIKDNIVSRRVRIQGALEYQSPTINVKESVQLKETYDSQKSSKIKKNKKLKSSKLDQTQLQTPPKLSPSLLQSSQRKMVKNDHYNNNNSRQLSSKSQSPTHSIKQKSIRKIKQKSSLLQTISMGQESP